MASSRATRGCGHHPDDSRQIAVSLAAIATAFQAAISPNSKPSGSVIEVLPGGRLEIGSIQPTMLGGPAEPLPNRPRPDALDDGPGSSRPHLDESIVTVIDEENHPIPSVDELDTGPVTTSSRQLRCRKRQPGLTQILDIKTRRGSHDHGGGFVPRYRVGLETGNDGPDQTGRGYNEDQGDQFPIHMAYNQEHPC